MADRTTRAQVEVAIASNGGTRATRALLEVAAYPQAGGRVTRALLEVMVAKPTAYTGGQNPDIPFVF